MNIQSEGDGEDEQGINNLFIGTIMHLCSKTKGNMKARCNAEEEQNNKLSNESEKEDESWDEVSYNHNEDKYARVESDSEMSWCELYGKGNGNVFPHQSDVSTSSRNYEGERELKRILKIKEK